MKVSLIVAVDSKGGIGKDNDLMWHLPDDMKFFKEKTSGTAVITGRKNYDSIPSKFRPLPNRLNIVVTRNKDFDGNGATIVNSLENAIQVGLESGREVFVIGGGQIYKEALAKGIVSTMYITHVDGEFDAEVFFPEFDSSNWVREDISKHQKDDKHLFAFNIVKYTRKLVK